MSNKQPENKDSLFELLKKMWLPVAGFLGAITLAYNFYQLWLGDQATVTYFLAGGGLVFLVAALIWVGFGYQTITRDAVWPIGAKRTERISIYPISYQKVSQIILSFMLLGLAFGVWTLVKHRQALEEKLVVVIATFDGPEDVYGLHNEIIENLNADFSKDSEVVIVPRKEVITPDDGISAARALGERYLADIVIWGWYRPTENPNVTIHIENLAPKEALPLAQSVTVLPQTTLAELETFTFQQQAGNETSSMVSFLAGYIKYMNYKYDDAILRFNTALTKVENNTHLLLNLSDIYFYRANSYWNRNLSSSVKRISGMGAVSVDQEQLAQALADYSKAIEANPEMAEAYYNRGMLTTWINPQNTDLDSNSNATISDFSQAILLNQNYFEAYIARGGQYLLQGEFASAISDFSKAILLGENGINSTRSSSFSESLTSAYWTRGNAYKLMGDCSRALDDFNKSLEVKKDNLMLPVVYLGMADCELILDNPQEAIDLYSRIIEDTPMLNAYQGRAEAYKALNNYPKAIEDYSTAIDLSVSYYPDYAKSASLYLYLNRGYLYHLTGDYQNAINDFDRIIDSNSTLSAEAYWRRGNARMKLLIKNFEHEEINDTMIASINEEIIKLLFDYSMAIQIDQNCAEAYMARGMTYQFTHQNQLAAEDYRKVIELTDDVEFRKNAEDFLRQVEENP